MLYSDGVAACAEWRRCWGAAGGEPALVCLADELLESGGAESDIGVEGVAYCGVDGVLRTSEAFALAVALAVVLAVAAVVKAELAEVVGAIATLVALWADCGVAPVARVSGAETVAERAGFVFSLPVPGG